MRAIPAFRGWPIISRNTFIFYKRHQVLESVSSIVWLHRVAKDVPQPDRNTLDNECPYAHQPQRLSTVDIRSQLQAGGNKRQAHTGTNTPWPLTVPCPATMTEELAKVITEFAASGYEAWTGTPCMKTISWRRHRLVKVRGRTCSPLRHFSTIA